MGFSTDSLDAMNPNIDFLREFADGEKRDVRESEKFEAAMWLYENRLLTGSLNRPLSGGGALLGARITALGRQFLQQESEKKEPHDSREIAYNAKHPIRAGIVITVGGGLLLAAALAYFAWVAHGI